MTRPQPGIFIEGDRSHWFVEIDVDEPASLGSALGRIRRAAAESSEDGGAELVVGFGPDLAAELIADVPDGLAPFASVGAGDRHAPATQRDLFLWIHGDHHDLNFEVVTEARRALAGVGRLGEDVPAWVYRDSRDLTGFIDGTENPEASEARELVLFPDGPSAGGTFAFTQRWVHDLDAFAALDATTQEAVIGRTRADSVELDPVPDDSHVGRVVIEDADGEELEIYRRSVPYGTAAEAGLYFLAFTADLGILDQMLRSMMGVDGVHDRLTDFSTPVSGSQWYVPSAGQLEAAAS